MKISRERSSSSSRPSRGSPSSSSFSSTSATPRPTSQPTFPTSNPSLTDLDPWESAEARTQMPPPSAPPAWGGASSTSSQGAPPTWRGAQPPQPTPRGQSWAPSQPSTAHNGFSQFRFFVFCAFKFLLAFIFTKSAHRVSIWMCPAVVSSRNRIKHFSPDFPSLLFQQHSRRDTHQPRWLSSR